MTVYKVIGRSGSGQWTIRGNAFSVRTLDAGEPARMPSMGPILLQNARPLDEFRCVMTWERPVRGAPAVVGTSRLSAVPGQSPKQIPRSRAVAIVSLASGTTFMRPTAASSG